MSSKDKESKSLQDKLKQYFKFKSGSANLPSRLEFTLTGELEKELSSETPIHKRLKAIKDLSEKVLNNRLDFKSLERIWMALQDLLLPEAQKDYRLTALHLHKCLIQGQYEHLQMMRATYFRYIKDYDIVDESQQRLELLQCLSENGKDIRCFEDEIGQFILDWMPEIQMPGQKQEFLAYIVNLIKYNAAYLDDSIMTGFVNKCCYLCCFSTVTSVVLMSLLVMETIVSYSLIPLNTLHSFICALCRTVNVEQYCTNSCKIIRNLLGTDIGHTAFLEILDIMSSNPADIVLTRGAIFYASLLWGTLRVKNMEITFISVLPYFLKALDANQLSVTYEVLLSIQTLILRHGPSLHEPLWDLLFTMLTKIIQQTETVLPANDLLSAHLQDTISSVELLYERKQYCGCPIALFDLVDRCGHKRPEPSVVKMINFKAGQLGPAQHDWLAKLAQLAERYCRQETRLAIRTHTLHTLHRILQLYRACYEEEVLERAVLPTLQQCAGDADTGVRCAGARLLTDLALHAHSKACADLIDLLEKILNRPFEMYVTDISLAADTDISDMRSAVDGLVRVFHSKLYRLPSSHAVRIYHVLVRHLELHYDKPCLFQHHPSIRWKIFELFLSARANGQCHVGWCYDAAGQCVTGAASLRVRPVYSPYVCVEGGTSAAEAANPPRPAQRADSPPEAKTAHVAPPTGNHIISYVSIRKACKLMVTCLTKEKEWSVLSAVLREIPIVMQSKPLVLTKYSNDIDHLATTLCNMVRCSVSDKSMGLPETLRVPLGCKPIGISEFHGAVLPVLACLAPYHAHLDPPTQQRIVKCLIKFGLVLRAPQQCISALTIFTLETRDTMVKLVPDVLLDLSKISDTTFIAGPILEFLSTLTRLPKVFASFIADQYMSVFAILLPYTNPSRYNHYVVSLAHHVIAAWFLKCRLPYRRDFVKFIIHGLHNYIIVPFEEARSRRIDFSQSLNEDSSTRKRSSSLGSKGREPLRGGPALGERRPPPHHAFHLELTETCVDLMARYTFSPCSVKPTRTPTAEFMFNGGQSATWLVGHKIVTITTSGCLQNSLKSGLCDRCLVLCKQHVDSIQSPLTGGGESLDQRDSQASEIKRYSKWTLQRGRSTDSSCSFSISDNSLHLPPTSGLSTRQNSSENKGGGGGGVGGGGVEATATPAQTSPLIISQDADTQAQLTMKLDKLERQSWSDEKGSAGASTSGSGSRAEEFVSRRSGCPCWCGGWAEVHVRQPTGDVSWVMRMQNQMNFDYLLESPLQDIVALLAPSLQGAPPPGPHAAAPSCSSASSGLGDSRHDILSDAESRSRSGSSSSQTHGGGGGGGAGELHKSSSDSVVPPHGAPAQPALAHASAATHRSHVSTEPINIPGSPQRQAAARADYDDDDNLLANNGKTRHLVRRSNSSPEMSSWKQAVAGAGAGAGMRADAEPEPEPARPLRPEDMIVLPSEPVMGHHHKKGGKKADMRVSCEAIPEEMSGSGSTPPHHPHLMTFKSDPGSTEPATQGTGEQDSAPPITTVSSDTALHTMAHAAAAAAAATGTALQKVASEGGTRSTGEGATLKVSSKPPAGAPLSPRAGGARVSARLPANAPAHALAAHALAALAAPEREREELPPLARSKRSNTISVMSPTRRRSAVVGRVAVPAAPQEGASSATNANTNKRRDAERSSTSGSSTSGNPGSSSNGEGDNPGEGKEEDGKEEGGKSGEGSKSGGGSGSGGGVTPAFVVLQLYHNMAVPGSLHAAQHMAAGSSGHAWVERPLIVSGDTHERSIKNLDRVPPLETYRIGVLYVGPGQHDDELKILKNEYGSIRYAEFLKDLGTLIALDEAEKHGLFLNVEPGGKDGNYTYVWQDDIMQVQFHVATLMPNCPNDPNANEKRKHIGNDYVSIVYNDSGEDFNIHTIKGQFNFCIVVVEPLEHGMNRVTARTKDELIASKFLTQTDSKVLTDQNVALLARQMALHCNLASLISRSLQTPDAMPYASNSLERLRIIKRMRERLFAERTARAESEAAAYSDVSRRVAMDDFTDYT